MTEFDNLRTLHAATTPGDWQVNEYGLITNDRDEAVIVPSRREGGGYYFANPVDESFIAAAKNELPALLARLDEVTAEKDALAAVVAEAREVLVNAQSVYTHPVTFEGKAFDVLDAAPSSVLAAHDAKVRAKALRDYANTLGVESNEEHDGDPWWDGYRQSQREHIQRVIARADKEENR